MSYILDLKIKENVSNIEIMEIIKSSVDLTKYVIYIEEDTGEIYIKKGLATLLINVSKSINDSTQITLRHKYLLTLLFLSFLLTSFFLILIIISFFIFPLIIFVWLFTFYLMIPRDWREIRDNLKLILSKNYTVLL